MALLNCTRGAGPSGPVVMIALVLAALLVSARTALAQEPLEDDVKAVFLFNFA